jgi:hypothetical protein
MRGFLSHEATPSSHPCYFRSFHYKPAIGYWRTLIYGNPPLNSFDLSSLGNCLSTLGTLVTLVIQSVEGNYMGVCQNLWNPMRRGAEHPCFAATLVWTAGYHDFRPMAILMAISKFEKPAHNLQDQMCWVVSGWTVSVFSLDHLMITWNRCDLRGLARWKKSGARKMSAVAQFFGGGSLIFAVQAKKNVRVGRFQWCKLSVPIVEQLG